MQGNVICALCFQILLSLSFIQTHAQVKRSATTYRASLQREDGNEIIFNFDWQLVNGKPVMHIINAADRIRVDSIRLENDSIFITMPVFESTFKAAVSNNRWNGLWIKRTEGKDLIFAFKAEISSERFNLTEGPAKHNISGRWAVRFGTDTTKPAASIAEFFQKGNKLTGTFLTPSGDYRYLEGVLSGNKLFLSGFDGGYAFLFTADVSNAGTIDNGLFISGARFKQQWKATKNASATVKKDALAMYLKPGEERLAFVFPDLNGNQVSINDDRFKNKVVVVQLMGSWCPNCMDETAFLSQFYNSNKQRGIEVIGLAYEYTTDFERSKESLKKFEKRFNVQYPVLITGVAVGDSLRTEKTLPQVTPIRIFPSSIIIDKKGKVRKFHNGFYGPGTGQHHVAYKKEFNSLIDELLKEE